MEGSGRADLPGPGVAAESGTPGTLSRSTETRAREDARQETTQAAEVPPPEAVQLEPAPPVAMPPETQGLILVLDSLLDDAFSLGSFAVGSVMLFCLDAAASPAVARAMATHLATRAVACAGPLGNMDFACLYCISDILHNAGANRCPGAGIYRSVFEELLPGIFHRVYVGLQAGSAEAELRVRHLLKVWRASDFYPTLYLDGA